MAKSPDNEPDFMNIVTRLHSRFDYSTRNGNGKHFSQVRSLTRLCKVGISALIALVDAIHTSIRTARNKRGDTPDPTCVRL
ncbi:hypothetical protein K443DRAFT_680588 [Laccaria amethystina LaAM-08-1]|uniref:Unplaced genomic scaffold K443scaffold_129, whole genome shotgun sequence n=1 Tax=Laccaria amethystina LaAM-08-1 TaxID=1095629 RepID=A0A0C9XRT7_9AGAR|nr:hypothetical protein K443DRAFT_680588 [Laccaria amethystina LaAM-08-1]